MFLHKDNKVEEYNSLTKHLKDDAHQKDMDTEFC